MAALLDSAMDMPAAEQAAWLQRLPPEQAPLLPKLRHLLARQHDGDETVFPDMPDYSAQELDELASEDDSGLSAGAAVGPYCLLDLLGRGGMGSVWLAERSDGTLKRKVALKLPHSNLPQRQLAERFARERDILAALTHPHIARLYDAGVSDDGRPYLALEYVQGEPITAYCDRRRLDVRARLEIFLQVLSALHYAHAQSVVHRDIKPSNILVTESAEVRLLDFGIAKLLSEGQASETELTQQGGRALTLQYASPEQILGRPMSAASDVYGLGVVLYELLTGSLPYRLKRDSRGALEDAILSTEPARPSRTEVLLGNAEVRASTTRKLAALLRGDLDTIILKALKKAPVERYATAQAFADDLRRYLAGEAVLAWPDSVWYRSRKFIVRHAVVAAAVTAVVAALAVGLGIALWQARVARQEAQTAQAVQAFMEDIFQANSSNQADPQKARQTSARELLDLGAKKIDSALADTPAAKLGVLRLLGRLYMELGLDAQAAALERKRVQLARSEFGTDSVQAVEGLIDLGEALSSRTGDPEWGSSLKMAEAILDRRHDGDSLLKSRLFSRLASFYEERDLPRAIDYADRAVAIRRNFPPDREFVAMLASAASARLSRGDWSRARDLAAEAVAIVEAPGRFDSRDQLPGLYGQMGYADSRLRRLAAADFDLRRAWELSRAQNGENHPDSIEHLADYGAFLVATGRARDGIDMLGRAARQLSAHAAATESYRSYAVFTRYGYYLRFVGRLEEAERALAQARDSLAAAGDSLLGAHLLLKEAELQLDLGRFDAAAQSLAHSEQIQRAGGALGSDRDRERQVIRLKLLLAQGRLADARDLLARLFLNGAQAEPPSMEWFELRQLRAHISLQGSDASSALRDADEIVKQIESGDDRAYLAPEEFRARLASGTALLALHRPREADAVLRRALILAESIFAPDRSPDYAAAQIAMAQCLFDLGRAEEAGLAAARARSIQGTHDELGSQFRQPLRRLERRLAAR